MRMRFLNLVARFAVVSSSKSSGNGLLEYWSTAIYSLLELHQRSGLKLLTTRAMLSLLPLALISVSLS
jgi:hypothetical protein